MIIWKKRPKIPSFNNFVIPVTNSLKTSGQNDYIRDIKPHKSAQKSSEQKCLIH